jgi:geranylgeranylglycerol-phosphate geranylgeranyltransferase
MENSHSISGTDFTYCIGARYINERILAFNAMAVSTLGSKLFQLIGSRIRKASVYTFATFAGIIIATRVHFSPEIIVLAPLSTLCLSLAIYLLNDLFDVETDRINSPNRPLVSQSVTKRDILHFIIFLNVAGIGIAYYLGIATFLLSLLEILLGVAYSVRPFDFKDRFILKTASIGLGGVLANLFGGIASHVVNVDLIFCCAMFLVYVFATSPLNDLADYVGDKLQNRRTIPIVIGPQGTIRLSILTSLIPPIASLVFLRTLDFNILAFAVLSLIAAWSLRLLLPLGRSEVSYAAVRSSQRKMVYFHFLLQGAFLLGSLTL